MSDTVLIERADGIARVTLNRPEVLNALNDELCDALVESLAQIEREPETRIMVLPGCRRLLHGGRRPAILLRPARTDAG